MIIIVVGTRPEIIKMAPVILELERRGLDFVFIHSGQHFDYEMSKIFIEELGLPRPDYSFELQSSKPASQIAEIIMRIDTIVGEMKKKPKIMLVQGDTNTIVAAAIAGLKHAMKIGHVEAGLRSYDWRMPEEHNRRMVDHISDYLFAPTKLSKRNLEEENVWGEIHVTGNTIIDALDKYMPLITKKGAGIIDEIGVEPGGYILTTFHRAENVDDRRVLKNFVEILLKIDYPIVYIQHPRTIKRLREYGLYSLLVNAKHIKIVRPLGYFEFITLLRNCRFAMTDSGGIQEEVTHPQIRKIALVLRTSTERPEAVEAGFTRVVGTSPPVVLAEVKRVLSEDIELPSISPFGDGRAAERIVSIVEGKVF